MFTSKEVTLLLERGRTLQGEIAAFTQRPNFASSYRLIVRIDMLIDYIKSLLSNPSLTEDDRTRLIIICFGKLIKNLKDIKQALKR